MFVNARDLGTGHDQTKTEQKVMSTFRSRTRSLTSDPDLPRTRSITLTGLCVAGCGGALLAHSGCFPGEMFEAAIQVVSEK